MDLDGGLWCEPTVVVNVSHDMDLMREETFGPIIPVMSFDSQDEAIRLANDSEYGLSAMIIGAEAEAATLLVHSMQAACGSISTRWASLVTQLRRMPSIVLACILHEFRWASCAA